jgi:hypothetical protein
VERKLLSLGSQTPSPGCVLKAFYLFIGGHYRERNKKRRRKVAVRSIQEVGLPYNIKKLHSVDLSTRAPKHAASALLSSLCVCFLSVVRAGCVCVCVCVCAMETLHYGCAGQFHFIAASRGIRAYLAHEGERIMRLRYVFAPRRVFFIMLILRFSAGMR